MSGIYNHRPMVPGRSAGVPEWLDMIKQEFESLSHEVAAANVQREEYEHKSNVPCRLFYLTASQRKPRINLRLCLG